MPKMTAMDAAISILYDEGVRHIFGIPGAGILPFYKSMKKHGRIKHLIARHEEGAIHMADGYARAIDTVGVCAATSGPGASNFVTGLYTAQVDSIPVLAITGQNVRAQLGREAFQAVDIAEICKPVTKKTYCVKEPAMVPWVFREAFRIMREGRPGPVLIDLPLDVQKGEIVYDPEADGPLAFQAQGPHPAAIRKARRPGPGRQTAGHAPGRRGHHRRGLRPLRPAGRVPPDPGGDHLHGQERHPVLPSPGGRPRRHPVQHPLRQQDLPRVGPRARRGRALQRPPHRGHPDLHGQPQVHPHRHRPRPARQEHHARARHRVRREEGARRRCWKK